MTKSNAQKYDRLLYESISKNEVYTIMEIYKIAEPLGFSSVEEVDEAISTILQDGYIDFISF